MKELLYVLFFQAIVAVNVAVILSAIIWLAKRKEEKDGQKPNPDFTPPPEKKPPKPPTTGTNVITPKEHQYDKYSCLYSPFCKLTREQVLDSLDKYIKKLEPYGYLDAIEQTVKEANKKPVQTTHICKNCKHFLTTDEEHITGTCGQNDEITFANSVRACFEPMEKKAEPDCTDCRWFVKWRDGDTTCANTGLHISANLKGAHCGYFEPKPKNALDALETAEKDWRKSKSCGSCRFSAENDKPNPNTVTCHFKQYHPVLRPRDGACWTCENYEPKPSASKVKPVPLGTKTTH